MRRSFSFTTIFFVQALTIFLVSDVYADTPTSAIGVWQLDTVRTVTEHMERMARISGTEVPDSFRESLTKQAEVTDRTVTLEITDSEIISSSPEQGIKTYPYILIGGNSAMVRIEYVDSEGVNSTSTIHLVDGGIAVETTDCGTYPTQCEREREKATIYSRPDDFAGGPPSEASASESERVERVYFRPAKI